MKQEFFPWKDCYSLGIENVDIQHKKLFELINSLFNSFMDKTTDENIKGILKELLDYTQYHFETEEKFLKEIGYPKLNNHIALHEAFKEKTLEFKHAQRQGNVITSTVMNYLRKWVSDHILKEDRDYVNYMK